MRDEQPDARHILAGFYDRDRPACNIPAPPGLPELAAPALHPAELPISAPDESYRLARLCGVSQAAYRDAQASAALHGTDIVAELVAARAASPERILQGLAQALALPVAPIRPQDRFLGPAPDDDPHTISFLRSCDGDFGRTLHVLPTIETLDAIRDDLAARPDLRPFARVAPRETLRAEIAARSAERRVRDAATGLLAARPRYSAFSVVEPAQCLGFAIGLSALAVLASHNPQAVLLFLHMAGGLLFLLAHTLRIGALVHRLPPARTPRKPSTEPLPVYSVLVALHREGEDVVERLVVSLSRLDWPTSRIEIKLVCEGDDHPTMCAVERAIAGKPQFECVAITPGLPRTKPKALNVVLPLLVGEYVVLYDAEDEPHPGQLREAHDAFRGDARLACVQAPLTIRNGDDSYLSAMFALEYAVLFRRFLPWLAHHDLPMPLGGTSNHFRRAGLVSAGGWDPHNVTEDADLGMRLARDRLRIGTITLPTLEDAPTRFDVWRPQRTRWIKGWCQTYLVHMRAPRQLLRDLGPLRFLVFQLLFAGLVGSALAHPFFLVAAGWTLGQMASGQAVDNLHLALFGLDILNFLLGYGVFAALAFSCLKGAERGSLSRFLWLLWPYWLLISYAFLRALHQLVVAPHHWNKTPHGSAAGTPRPLRENGKPAGFAEAGGP